MKLYAKQMEGVFLINANKELPDLLNDWGLFPMVANNQPILTASPGSFRKYRNDQESQPKDNIPLNGLGSPAISAQAWKTFWRMDMPHAIRTPWWRTLQRKIPTNERLHNIFPGKCSSICRICGKEIESDKHFWMECHHKLRTWVRLMEGKKLGPELWSPDRIWNLMSFQQIKPQDEQILSEMGRVMLAIWITH